MSKKPRTAPGKANTPHPMGSTISGAVTKVIVGAIAGVGTTLGVIFSPLQKTIFNLVWKEQPAVSLLLSPAKAIEGDVIDIDVIVSPLNTAVGLSGGTLTLSVDNQYGTLLLDGGKEQPQEVSGIDKIEGQKVIHRQLIAIQPGMLKVNAVIKANGGESAEATGEINVAVRPAGTCKFIENQEYSSSFQGHWHFDFNTLGSFEIDMREGEMGKLTGEFRSSSRETGRFEGGRDGHKYWGVFTFKDQPLRQIKIDGEYERKGGFLTTPPGGTAILETLSSANRFDWKPSVKESIGEGYCRLH